MGCTFFNDASRFLEVAAPFLAMHEAENTVLVGHVLRRLRRPRSDMVMGLVQKGDAVRLAASMTPPLALVLSAGDIIAVSHLVTALRERRSRLPGVTGIEPLAKRFAALWQDCRKPAIEPDMRTILYRANHIAAPEHVPGELRMAAAHDVAWLAGWQRRFAEQAGLDAAERASDMHTVTAMRIARGEMFYWAVEGRPVASAAFVPTTPAADAGRINAVFTLEEERGKGYASACVAALSRRLFDRGWRYSLVFANRENAITTRLYPRLGYQEIAAFISISFRDR